MTTSTETEGYPRMLRRLRGVFIDGIVWPLAAIGTLVALTYAGVENPWLRIGLPLLVIFLLDPVAVSLTGGSIGHHLTGLRIRKERVDERIGVLAASVRFVVKAVFGLPAFFVAFITHKRQGLHDLAARSLIVYKDAESIPAHERMPARTVDDERATYASAWRRLLVVLLYWVLLYISVGFVIAAVMFGPCSTSPERCTPMQSIAALVALATLVIGFIVIALLGWRGRLYGCRKRRETGTSIA
jgi:uncharacterized RDD family membrane protein YckC